MPQISHVAEPQAGPTLSKAVVRAAATLHVNQAALADTIGMSRATASRLHSGGYVLDPGRKKEWELALLFVRMFRSLDAILGHGEQARLWLESDNLALNGRPADLIRTTEGLIRVIQYLDAYRGRV
ncbi:MAG: MbcA/ParS/Xre antitoxin family protein [Magnetospirillum sp. WYHS-4]